MMNELENGVWWTWTMITILVGILILILILISRQPTAQRTKSFSVPFIPWLPGISIIINLYLMMKLDYMTWVKYTGWVAIGMIIYFTYGIRNSKEGTRRAKIVMINNTQTQPNLFMHSKDIFVPTGQ